MHAVVTGGAGHIGSRLVHQLVERGDTVTVIDDLSTGSLDHLPATPDAVHVVHADVRNALRTGGAIAAADVVFHLAAAVGVPRVLADPTAAVATNVDGTRVVVEACRELGARLVFASTSEVYGRTTRLPMREDDELVIGPPTSPRWSYALAKALDEHLVLEAGRAGLDVTILRYFNSYGPAASLDGDGGVVTRFVRQALRGEPLTVHGDGTQVRCFTYVDDVARATLLAGTHPALVGQVANVGSTAPITISELASAVLTATASAAPLVSIDATHRFGTSFDETRLRIPSVERLRRLAGWAPSISLDEGLERTVRWYRMQLRRAA